jgi:hypothetical protein
MSIPDWPSPSLQQEKRLLKSVLGGAIPDFVARFGVDAAVKRVEAELRNAKRARSRKLYAFWTTVLADIETGAQGDVGFRDERPRVS